MVEGAAQSLIVIAHLRSSNPFVLIVSSGSTASVRRTARRLGCRTAWASVTRILAPSATRTQQLQDLFSHFLGITWSAIRGPGEHGRTGIGPCPAALTQRDRLAAGCWFESASTGVEAWAMPPPLHCCRT